MSKKLVYSALVVSIFLYSASAAACPYCNGGNGYRYHNNDYTQKNSQLSKLINEFDSKRYELNQLYDSGVSDNDEKVKSLVKELDALSLQIKTEEDALYNRPYRNRSDNGYHNRCW